MLHKRILLAVGAAGALVIIFYAAHLFTKSKMDPYVAQLEQEAYTEQVDSLNRLTAIRTPVTGSRRFDSW